MVADERWASYEMESHAYLKDVGAFRLGHGGRQFVLPSPWEGAPQEGYRDMTDVLGRPYGVGNSAERWDYWEHQAHTQLPTWFVGAEQRLKTGFPVEESTGWDLLNARHAETLLMQQELHTPRWISFALGLRPDKPYGRLDARSKHFYKERERRSLRAVKKIATRQVERGHNFPVILAVGFHLKDGEEIEELVHLAGMERPRLFHLCSHELRDPSTGGRVKRPLLLITCFEARHFGKLCPGPPPHHVHANLSDVKDLPFDNNTAWCEGSARAMAKDVREFRAADRAAWRMRWKVIQRFPQGASVWFLNMIAKRS